MGDGMHVYNIIVSIILCAFFTFTVKGRREVNLPLDDYFMALAVLATTRSPYATSEWPNKVSLHYS